MRSKSSFWRKNLVIGAERYESPYKEGMKAGKEKAVCNQRL